MTQLEKIILGILSVAMVGIGIVTFTHPNKLGDATVSNYPTWYYNGIVIGPANSLINNIIQGSCTPSGATAVGANTSETITCPVPNTKVGDKPFVSSTTGSVSTNNNGFTILASKISTAGTLSLIVGNLTTTTSTPNLPINYTIFR